MEIVNIKVKDLKPYDKNAKKHDQTQIDNVAKSIEKYGFVQPLVIDKNNVVIIGHCRLEASKKLKLKEVPCVLADTLTDEQVKELRLLDNKLNESDWDYDLIKEEIAELSFDDFDLDWGIEENILDRYKDKSFGTLVERFGIPTFSVFDTRQGYWQNRKQQWKDLGIKSELGRDENLLGLSEVINTINNGSSIFDPVLCEIIYKWFCVENGKILDCFAGGSVRGIVAEKLGYKYTGIDLRQEQIDANNKNAEEIGLNPIWYCDDALNVDKYVKDESQDFIFSCPPYADLEKYSDDERDLSNMEYDEFKQVYFEIIKRTCRKLKQNRFACFVVGDVRDKDGFYYNFVDDTKKAFLDAGLKFYNDIILVNAVGTGALRANRLFATRKVVKMHQNVLVFYKGNPKEIKNNFKEVYIDNLEEEIEND